jgi:hypothetical protein
MKKTFKIPRAVTNRAIAFGLLFLMGLLAAVSAGCGDGTGPEIATDSGTVGTGTRTSTGTGTGTGTCKVPTEGMSMSSFLDPPGAPLPYLVTDDPITCADLSSYMAMPSFKGLTCHDLATDDDASYAIGPGFWPCCVMVSRANCPGKGCSSGPVSVTGVSCDGLPKPSYVLCSSTGTFLGWACALP